MTEALTVGLAAATGPQAAALALAALGLRVQLRQAGVLNFGQAGFMLAGGYGVAVTVAVVGGPLWLGVVAGVLLAMVVAWIASIGVLDLPGEFTAVVTLAGAELLRGLVRSAGGRPWLGGVFGLDVAADGLFVLNPVPPGQYGFLGSERDVWIVLVAWGVTAGAVLLVRRLERSPWGRAARGQHDDGDLSRALGKDVRRLRRQGLVLGAALGACGGIVLVLHAQQAQLWLYTPVVGALAFAAVVLGGVDRSAGPVVGAALCWFVLGSLQHLFASLQEAGTLVLPSPILGQSVAELAVLVALLVVLVVRPAGLLGAWRAGRGAALPPRW